MNTQTAVKERSIIMGPESVRAILDGRKTETRRVIKPQPTDGWPQWWHGKSYGNEAHFRRGAMLDYCPYGQVGDRLWVRETFYAQPGLAPLTEPQPIHYALDVPDRRQVEDYDLRPSIHMPRWASRITLEIVEVRAERLQDITEEGAIAEGVECWNGEVWSGKDKAFYSGNELPPIRRFEAMWDSINARHGYPFFANHWMWVITFRRVEG